MSCEQLWLGGLTASSVRASAKLNLSSSSVRLACRPAAGGAWVRGSAVETAGNIAKLECGGLEPDTAYVCRVEPGAAPAVGMTGSFCTAPAGNGAFTVAFGGDASNGSNSVVFDAIRALNPLMFVALGDQHYSNLLGNDRSLFRAAYDEMLSAPLQRAFWANLPSGVAWDDHDAAGGNNCDGTAAGRDAACLAYRERIPHYDLADTSPTGHIGQSWVLASTRLILTDQRSMASPSSAVDNASKSMLGSAQVAWLESEISAAAAAHQLVVWICPRMFGGVATVGADHWGGFTTERLRILAHINAVHPGCVCVISADAHCLAIDDGSNHWGLPTFQAAPLDRTPDSTVYGGATYSEGWFNGNGQFGTMRVEPSGSGLLVTWTGHNASGATLVTHSFTVTP